MLPPDPSETFIPLTQRPDEKAATPNPFPNPSAAPKTSPTTDREAAAAARVVPPAILQRDTFIPRGTPQADLPRFFK